jgi:predicted regulator of Ras-like GTPase activity (Roadblock/LC7/MglB family)
VTPFAAILRGAVERTPGAIGGAFAAYDGEMVDSFFHDGVSDEWAIFTAHYGIVLSHVQSALNTWHYGEAELVMIEHSGTDILMGAVLEGYYALIAIDHPASLATAMREMAGAVAELRREMG